MGMEVVQSFDVATSFHVFKSPQEKTQGMAITMPRILPGETYNLPCTQAIASASTNRVLSLGTDYCDDKV